MDPVAHTLFGATLAESGLKRKTALATGALIIGANIPDIDAVAMLAGSDIALQYRRGWTHGIPALLIWPFVVTGMMLAFDRFAGRRKYRREQSREQNGEQNREQNCKQSREPRGVGRGDGSGVQISPQTQSGTLSGPPLRPGVLLGISFIGVWSHPLLDWVNIYGIRLLMPFSDTWFYGDTLFILDPWIWLLAGAGVVLARSESRPGITGWIVLGTALTALVTSTPMVPVAAKIVWVAGVAAILLMRLSSRHRNVAQPVALVSLVAILLYLAFMYTGARMTAGHARNILAEDGIVIHEVMANPPPARPLFRTGIAASDTHYYRFRINWMSPGSFELFGDPVPIEAPDRIVEAALRSPDVQGLRNWMRFPTYEVRELDDGWRVFIRDLRYADPDQESPAGIGMSVVDLDEALQVR